MSDKPMTELLSKSGIIDRHIEEFKKWRLIDENGMFTETKSAETMVGDLVEEIGKLLDQEPVMKQTLVQPVRVHRPPEQVLLPNGESFYAVRDEMGRLIISSDVDIQRGDMLLLAGGSDYDTLVLEVENLYENDRVVARMITIEKEEA